MEMDRTSLSHPRATTHIKDPIHDEITLTCFEREIVDSEHFQRLHFILQNSTTYVAFPSNKNSRFSHSLGVKHLCGQLFVNSLMNATPQNFDDLLENAGNFVHEISVKANAGAAKELRSAWKKTISGQSQFRHAPSLRGRSTGEPLESRSLRKCYPNKNERIPQERRFTAGFLVDTLWQAISVCGLVHDIGHLPMSHSLERALDIFVQNHCKGHDAPKGSKQDLAETRERIATEFRDEITTESAHRIVFEEFSQALSVVYPNKDDLASIQESFRRYPIHEKRSLFILHELFHKGVLQFTGEIAAYRKLIYHISFLILLSSINSNVHNATVSSSKDRIRIAEKLEYSAFRFMRLIVSGSIDADRMDYTIRDGYSCGSAIGQFDISQIIKCATMFCDKRNNEFRIGFYYRALPAIEQFFMQRHQGYKYLIYHRTSSRTEVCLQNAMSLLLEYCYGNPTGVIAKRFAELGYISLNDGFKVFPVFLDFEVEKLGDIIGGENVPHIDDSGLRSYLDWLLTYIRRRTKLAGPGQLVQLERLYLLLRIVQRREFRHIFDPFKDSSITERAKSAVRDYYSDKKEADENFEKFRHMIAKDVKVRNACKDEFQRSLNTRLKEKAQVILGEQKPKIYDHEISSKKGEEVFLLYNGVSDEGELPAEEVTSKSPVLRIMGDIFVKEFRINCYFIAKDIKSNPSLIKEIDECLDIAIKDTVALADGYLEKPSRDNSSKEVNRKSKEKSNV